MSLIPSKDEEIGEIRLPEFGSVTNSLPQDFVQNQSHRPVPQDSSSSFRVYGEGCDERRFFQKTAQEKTFRPIHIRNTRFQQSESYTTNKHTVDNFTNKFFRWAFRSPLVLLIVTAQVTFFAWTLLFALLHVWNVYVQPHCVTPYFDPQNEPFRDVFRDCWQLSYTTFATVGYGVISPSAAGSPFYSSDKTAMETVRSFRTDKYCFAQSFLCSVEAFVGILFAGFWTAVMFSKVAKVNNKARVSFSSNMVVQYGFALCKSNHLQKPNGLLPCPILEFRIVNIINSQQGGGILNASVNVVASLRKERLKEHVKTESTLRKFTSSLLLSVNRKKSSGPIDTLHKSMSVQQSNRMAWLSTDPLHKSLSVEPSSNRPQDRNIQRVHSAPLLNMQSSIDSENSLSGQSPSRSRVHESSRPRASAFVFTPLKVEPNNYPLFQNVWTIRHVLDEKSPLLNPKIRNSIKKHPGYWSEDKCSSPEEVRHHIQFEKILVSFSGISQLNASPVYAQTVYDFKNLHVGYEFENMLVKQWGNLAVEVKDDKVSAIKEQGSSDYSGKLHEE